MIVFCRSNLKQQYISFTIFLQKKTSKSMQNCIVNILSMHREMNVENATIGVMNENEEWSEIITTKRHLFDVRLREVWRYKDLLFMFVKRDFIAQYRQTI